MSDYLVTCSCHCRHCGNSLSNCVCLPPQAKESKWLTFGGLLLSALVLFLLAWFFMWRAY